MKPAVLLTPFIPWLALLASCGSPPKPPAVDEARKRPVNTAMAVELQVCTSNLENQRLHNAELQRLAQSVAAAKTAQQDLTALVQALARPSQQARPPLRPNRIAAVRFEYGSTRVEMPPETAQALIREAKAAPLVLLRARTDGTSDDASEGRVARARATAVADYLIHAGLSPSQIRATYQPSGDHVADNSTPGGRALNRRVEIEIYSALPVALDTQGAADTPSH